MTRVAALYDIHGNLPALEAVLDDVERAGVELIVIGGDVVPGPMPRETIARLRALNEPARFIQGNGEREIVGLWNGVEPKVPPQYRGMMRWVADAIGEDGARWLAGWPDRIALSIDGLGDVLFCHATPRNDTDIFTRMTPEACVRHAFAGVTAPVVVCGHTHMQFDRAVGAHRVINAGSVGMPFGEPGAYWALLGSGVELRRTPYDLNAAAVRVRATAYPQAQEFAAREILQPRSESEMMAVFAGAELKP
jgi:predicted phosphodiesterase